MPIIRFDNISKDHPINIFFGVLINALRMTNQSYLFGSATWRLYLNQFDETCNDLDFLIDFKYEDSIKLLIFDLCDKLDINITTYELVSTATKNKYIIDYTSKHIILVLNDYFSIDFIYTKNMDHSKKTMSDVDIGMLLYNLTTDKFEIAGNLCDITPEQLIEYANTKQLTFEYIKHNIKYRTKYSRIIKLLNYGFQMNPQTANIHYVQIVIDILQKSFVVPHDYILDRNEPDKTYCKPSGDCCICLGADINFISTCLNKSSYAFAKKCYSRMATHIKLPNSAIDILLAYACFVKDFDYALELLKMFNVCKLNIITSSMKYIPMILRQHGDFTETIKFLKVILDTKQFVYNSVMFCGFPVFKTYFNFTVDAIFAGDLDYYDNLVKYNSMFDIESIKSYPAHYLALMKRYNQEVIFRKDNILNSNQKNILI